MSVKIIRDKPSKRLKSWHVEIGRDGTRQYFINDIEVTEQQYKALVAALQDGTFSRATQYHWIAKGQQAYEHMKAELGNVFLELAEDAGSLEPIEFGTPEYDAAWRGQ